MASSYRLRRFSSPGCLKSVAPNLLREFLHPYNQTLAERGVDLSSGAPIDYPKLAAVLMSPDHTMPDAMLDALFFVDEMSTPNCFDDLVTESQAWEIDLGSSMEPSAADLAVRIWLKNPDALERMHAERFLLKPKSFHSFLATASVLPALEQPSPQKLAALEAELNDWFETRKRGRGTRVFVFIRENRAWFLIRHGEPYKREGTLEGDESSSVYYRPEKFDVLAYNGEVGELAIHAGTKGEQNTYCRAIGKHLFGSEEYFDISRLDGKFTLRPIAEDGRACLSCADNEEIEEIQLVELHFRHDSHQYHVEVHKADDVFSALEDIGRQLSSQAILLKANFRVKFKNASRPRTLVVRPPAVTIFDRESDAEVLEKWLTARGFIRVEYAEIDAAVAAA